MLKTTFLQCPGILEGKGGPPLCCLLPAWSCGRELVCPRGELGELIWLGSCFCIYFVVVMLYQGCIPAGEGQCSHEEQHKALHRRQDIVLIV